MQYIRTLHAILKPPSTRAGLHLTRTRISPSMLMQTANYTTFTISFKPTMVRVSTSIQTRRIPRCNATWPCALTNQSRRVLDDDPAKAKERLADIEPPLDPFFSGALAPMPAVKPGSACVKGVWLPGALSSPKLNDEKVTIHFPGGAFVITFGHEGSGRPVSETLTKWRRSGQSTLHVAPEPPFQDAGAALHSFWSRSRLLSVYYKICGKHAGGGQQPCGLCQCVTPNYSRNHVLF